MPSGEVGLGEREGMPAEDSAQPVEREATGEKEPSKSRGSDAVSVLWTFGKCLGALLPIYLAGYFRVSTSLVVFGLMVYTGWKHTRDAKEARLRSAMQLVNTEQEATATKAFRNKRDLPSWVNFPDVERVEWLNKVLQQAWPFIGQYLEKLLVETIAPSIRASSTHLQTLGFTKIDFGNKAMKVVGVKAHTENDKGQVLLDLYISYVGDVEINVEVKRYFCTAGVKGIQLNGMMRVILEPLIGDVPIVGAVTMFFIKRPKLDINWTGMTNLLDIPGLNVMSDTMIMDAIASFLVLPNRLTVPLVADLHIAQLRSPLPRGVVRIHLLEAEDLASKDNYMKGVISGMSDPYAVLRVGPQTFTSRHVDNNLNPQWREMYEVIVHEVPGQELEVEVYDKDPDHDDFLGRAKVDLGIVKKARILDEWFTLKDTRSGRVHLKLEWLSLLSSTDHLDQILERNKAGTVSSKTSDPPSAAILTVYLDRAQGLPMKKGDKEPSPMVQFSVQDLTRESRPCFGTTNPEWNDAFTFFIQDPCKQDIDIEVKDNDRVLSLGSLSIPLSRLLNSPNLSMDQWFQLNNSGPASRIYINAVLRVLWLDEEGSLRTPAHGDTKSFAWGMNVVSRPEKTSPDPSFATEGVLRIHLVEAQNLIAKDNLMGGMVKGKSDPYVKIHIGSTSFRSHVINKNLNPTWNELYEVILTKLPGQEVQFELFDKDMDKDDFMGRFKVSLRDIISNQLTDEWYTLNDVKSGQVHVVLEWVPTVVDPARLEQVLQSRSQQSYQNKAVPSAAVLFVYVESAHALPLRKSGKEAVVGAELVLGETSYKTKLCDRSASPQWDEAFHFLVCNPREDILITKLFHKWDEAIGSLALPVRELLLEEGLTLDHWLSVDGASLESQILLRAELKILDSTIKEIDSVIPHKETVAPANQDLRRRGKSTIETKGQDPPRVPVSPHSPVSVPVPGEAKGGTNAKVVSEDVKVAPGPPDTKPHHTSPDPSFATEGVLRIHLVEAQNLIAKDNLMGGMVKGKSDPYVKTSVGTMTFCSHVIKENINPSWNELYEVVLTQQPGQEVQFELYDKDMDKDDFLGRFKVSLRDIISNKYIDQWYPLNDVKSGQVHVVLEWVPTVVDPARLEQVLQSRSQQSYQNKAVPSAAVLFVYVESAHALPLKKSGKEPNVGAELVLGGNSYRTKVCDRSTAPRWDEAFYFLVCDPKVDILNIKLSHTGDQVVGSLVLPVRELLSQPGLGLDRWHSLDGAPPESQILLRAELKILDSKITERGGVNAHLFSAHDSTTSAVGIKEMDSVIPHKEKLAPANQDMGHKTEQAIKAEGQDPPSVPVSPHSPVSVPVPGEAKGGTNAKVVSEDVKVAPGPPDTKPHHTSPDPSFATEGVLRIHLVEAQNLIAKDNLMGGMVKGKSDPYVKIHIGSTSFRSHVIDKNLNPTWNELYEVVLTKQPGQEVQFELYDKDLDKDDFLGRFKVSLKDIISSQYTDQWYPLNDVKSGQVHVVLEWVPTVVDPARLEQVLQFCSQQSYQNKAVPSAAVLFVYVESAHALPLKKSGKEPKVGAELVLGGSSYRTKVCDRSISPRWNEKFYFLVCNPRKDILIVKLSHTGDQVVGSLVLPVRELLSQPGLGLDRWHSLDGAPPESQILLRAELKILDSRMAKNVLGNLVSAPLIATYGELGTGAQVKLSLSYTNKENKLVIVVHACRHLSACSKDGSDPYVSFILLPDKSKATKRKTSIKKKDLNPTYNERFDFQLSLEEARNRQMDLSVKNDVPFMSRERELIGKVQIELKDVDLLSGVTQWYDLMEETN